MPNLTTNQHYIWQHYLRAWGAPKKIWCKRIDQSEPFYTSPRNVGAERFFYEFQELTEHDLAYLETVISSSNDDGLRQMNRKWIKNFQLTFVIRKLLRRAKIDPKTLIELECKLREVEKTMGESFHSDTENRAISILDALRAGNAGFYADQADCFSFIDYISHQYFRTAKLRNAILAIPNPLPHDMSRTWPIEAFIYATNVASSFVRQRHEYRIVLLRNKSDVPFITGDQPVINLLKIDVEEVDLFYPLQPDLAMIFTANRTRYSSDTEDVGRISVESYNYRIYAQSGSQIYGNDRAYLASIANLPKDPMLFKQID